MIIIFLLIILFGFAYFICYRLYVFRRYNQKIADKRFLRMKELTKKFESGNIPAEQEILDYAHNVLTRYPLYYLLRSYNRPDLFPQHYFTTEKAAESQLANWLEFPTELGTCPSEFHLVKIISITVAEKKVDYYVFRFRINEPHWAAKNGWMLGVAGPYLINSTPYDFSKATFSRLNSIDSISAEQEAEWVHNHFAFNI